jgi:hypothetical protein
MLTSLQIGDKVAHVHGKRYGNEGIVLDTFLVNKVIKYVVEWPDKSVCVYFKSVLEKNIGKL